MKYFAFHLMPWDRLPADFDTNYRSAWTTLPNAIYDPEHGHELYNRYLDELVLADDLGFDGVCVNEHHQNAYGTMPSPNLITCGNTTMPSARASSQLGACMSGMRCISESTTPALLRVISSRVSASATGAVASVASSRAMAGKVLRMFIRVGSLGAPRGQGDTCVDKTLRSRFPRSNPDCTHLATATVVGAPAARA